MATKTKPFGISRKDLIAQEMHLELWLYDHQSVCAATDPAQDVPDDSDNDRGGWDTHSLMQGHGSIWGRDSREGYHGETMLEGRRH